MARLQQLHLDTCLDYTEQLSDFLEQAHALSITWQALDEQALYEPPLNATPLWQRVKISALFTAETSLSTVIDKLYTKFGQFIFACHYESVADRAWERVWLDEFKPLCFAKRLWICPSAYEPPDVSMATVHLDPGLAFGTGTHPSTALCLEWLAEQHWQQETVIDYGCGSGILAIAALKLGAKKVLAIDHDPQALLATAANAQKNQLNSEHLVCLSPQAFVSNEKVDILVANILAQPLMALAATFKCCLKQRGQLVLAGILDEQVNAVQQAYSALGFEFVASQHKQGWVCLVGRWL